MPDAELVDGLATRGVFGISDPFRQSSASILMISRMCFWQSIYKEFDVQRCER